MRAVCFIFSTFVNKTSRGYFRYSCIKNIYLVNRREDIGVALVEICALWMLLLIFMFISFFFLAASACFSVLLYLFLRSITEPCMNFLSFFLLSVLLSLFPHFSCQSLTNVENTTLPFSQSFIDKSLVIYILVRILSYA